MTKLWKYLVILTLFAFLINFAEARQDRSKRKCKRRKSSLKEQTHGMGPGHTKTEWKTDYVTVYGTTPTAANIRAGATVTEWSTSIVYVPKSKTSAAEPTGPSASNKQAHDALTQPGDWKAQMLELVNVERRKKDMPDVQLLDKLNEMAQAHSQYQYEIKTMTHKDTKPMGQRAGDLGIVWTGISENVAFGYKNVEDVMKGWVKSKGHYNNIVGDANYAGFGVVDNYWTQNFAYVTSVK
ncbi:hypothetical protein H4R99_000681 [Coemansia sp. RSA 1722]|nr:hypothetical protein LPJ57_000160 [Coemansia sp. RSA 486]KAJ2605979.1 hypothetical protein H4R99_000681 [Coemansia sp. RSA 1722]